MIGLSPHVKQRDDEGGDEGRKAEDEKAQRGQVREGGVGDVEIVEVKQVRVRGLDGVT